MWRARVKLIINKPCVRSCSTDSRHIDTQDTSAPKPFENIPGPKSFPIIGTLYKYVPFIGEYNFTRLHRTGLLKFKHYGPLVREQIIPGVSVIWVFRPEDIAKIFQAEAGLHPERRSHLALLKYRKDRSNIYNTGGLLPTNGAEWWKLRKEFQKVLSKPRNVLEYLKDTDLIVQQFIQLCSREKTDDFLPLFSRLFLELTCLVAFDVRMQSFSEEERHPHSRSSRLIDAALVTNSVILKLDNGLGLWKYFDTPLYRKLLRAQNYMEEVALQMISRRNEVTSISRTKSLLEEYLKNKVLDMKDIMGMACDMLLAGIDTTTYTIAFGLYYLAKNPDIQEKLRIEATALLEDHNSPVTAETLNNAIYTKAVIKETFRMNPISVGIGRILQTDVILSGYNVPRGVISYICKQMIHLTVVVTQNQVTCRLSEYFNEPNSFIPERWLRSKESTRESVNPYLVLPFGHGPRSCIARRFAEQSIQVTLLRICRNLRFTWHGDALDAMSLLINKPDAPIKLKFDSVHE